MQCCYILTTCVWEALGFGQREDSGCREWWIGSELILLVSFAGPGLIPMRICSKVPAGQPTRTTGPLRLLPRRPPCARFTSRFGVVLLHGSKQPPLAGGCCSRSKGWENRVPAVSRFSPRDRLCTAARNRPCPRWQHSTPTHHKPSCWLLRHLVRRVSSSTSRNAFFFVSECEKKKMMPKN
jgi:hypothetical protein